MVYSFSLYTMKGFAPYAPPPYKLQNTIAAFRGGGFF